MTVPDLLPRTAVADYLAGVIRLLNFEVLLKDNQAPPPEKPPRPARLGINLAWVNNYATELPFNDVLKGARPWRDGSTVVCVDIGDHYPAGIYTCTYEGDTAGTLAWSGAASEVGGPPGSKAIMVKPSKAGIRLKVTGSVSNVRLFPPNTADDGTWRHGFLSRWNKFKVVRFMDWQRTNHSKLSKWEDRTTPDSETQGGEGGVAYEHMIALCNTTQSDPWFCIPHLADDEFVERLASMVWSRLDPGRKVYVEHSNEVWNSHFSQSAYATQQGLALGLSTNPNEANALYHAQRTCEIGNIFGRASRGSLVDDRLVTVLGSQTVNTWLTRTMLDHVYDGFSVSDHVDVVGIAPYLGAASDPSKTVGDYLSELERNIPGLMARVRDQVTACGSVPLVAYEGGQGLEARGQDQDNPTVIATLIATNNAPGMHRVYEKYLSAWEEASGGGLMMHYSSTRQPSTKNGSCWGALEFYDSNESEPGKYTALVDYAEES